MSQQHTADLPFPTPPWFVVYFHAYLRSKDGFEGRLAEYLTLLPGQALFNLGKLQRQCGEFEGAIANYEGVLEISPDHWRGLLNYSVALVGVGRHDDAKRALRRAFKLSGARPPFASFAPPCS